MAKKKKNSLGKNKRKNSRLKISSKKGVKRNKLTRGILVVVILLAILLVVLLLLNAGFFEAPKEEKLFVIQDACSLVMGNIIHQIRDSGDCKIRCRNDCDLEQMEFIRVEFALQNNSCHVCDCYCK